jgi:hypothetical protein
VGGFTEGQLEEMGYKGGEGDEDFRYASIPNLFMRRIQRTVSRVSTQVRWPPRSIGTSRFSIGRRKHREKRHAVDAAWHAYRLPTTIRLEIALPTLFRSAPSRRSLR